MLLAHSLLSGVLLLLPIAITVGVYIGIEFQKIFHSGFEGTYGVLDPGFAGGPSNSDGIRTTRYCQKTIGVTPKGGRYTCELSHPLCFSHGLLFSLLLPCFTITVFLQ